MNSATTQDSRAGLLDALHGLEIAARDFAQDVGQRFPGSEILFRDLERVINRLGLEPASRPRPRPDYVQQWNEFLVGQRERLEFRAVRYLCWEPDVATDGRFQDYLEQDGVNLSARSLQGLVRACHARWSSVFAASPITER